MTYLDTGDSDSDGDPKHWNTLPKEQKIGERVWNIEDQEGNRWGTDPTW